MKNSISQNSLSSRKFIEPRYDFFILACSYCNFFSKKISINIFVTLSMFVFFFFWKRFEYDPVRWVIILKVLKFTAESLVKWLSVRLLHQRSWVRFRFALFEFIQAPIIESMINWNFNKRHLKKNYDATINKFFLNIFYLFIFFK